MKTGPTLLITLLFLLSCPLPGRATEEFAKRTHQECRYCHIDPAGGGELTSVGKGYLLSLQGAVPAGGTKLEAAPAKTSSHIFRLIVGYLHMLTAFFWFGTILYVHLILKPAYASKGLPRGEVRVGLVSIVIMAVTGTILTLYRIPSLELLLTTRFGILLAVKICLFLVMAGSALVVVFFIGPRLMKKEEIAVPEGGEMSEEELAFFDGKEGRRACFAYQGKIYDVTDSKLWKNGTHMARHNAGCDLTAMLLQAPHGESRVLSMPVAGSLVDRKSTAPGIDQKKVFFFMAYMNLTSVLLIVLILALWKWW
jgi:predicted heme/steroid binding protein/uncharacterized membrane protein